MWSMTVSWGIATAFLVLYAVPSFAGDRQAIADTDVTIFHKQVPGGEIACIRGPNRLPASMRGIWGDDVVDNLLAVYELRVQWRPQNAAAVDVWSRLFVIYKMQMRKGRFQEIKVPRIEPMRPEGVDIMDIGLLPSRQRGTDVLPAQIVLAVRRPEGSDFSLCLINQVVGEGPEVSWWHPTPGEWTEYDVSIPGDPSSMTLSVSPVGQWQVEIKSMDMHTRFEQIGRKWEFTKTTQWREK